MDHLEKSQCGANACVSANCVALFKQECIRRRFSPGGELPLQSAAFSQQVI